MIVTLNPAVGPRFLAVSRPGGNITAAQQTLLRNAMTIARRRLRNAVNSLVRPFTLRVTNCLDYSFKLAYRDARVNKVRNELSRLNTRLRVPDIQIVQADPGRGGVGYVRMAWYEMIMPGRAFGVTGRRLKFSGRIHIPFNAPTANNLASTLIHEAAHKFLGVRDYCQNVVPIVHARLAVEGIAMHAPLYDAMTTNKAINNADSYAAFAMEL